VTARITASVRITDASAVAEARRAALQCAEASKLGETSAARAALVATELATNLVKHVDGGSLLFGEESDGKTITITSIDKGKGIANVRLAMSDGFSTAGSPGTGLGAVERASISVGVYTLPAKGTIVHCVVGDSAPPPASPLLSGPRFSVAGVGIPKQGETANGDAWSSVEMGNTLTIGVADGLGHGPMAATASIAAARVFASGGETPLERLLEDAHGALRSTRGAAVGVARIHGDLGRVDFIGVGNIAGTIVNDSGTRKVVSLPGIVGHEMRKLQTFSYPWDSASTLILQSDGISANWSVASYPGLMQREPATIAAALFRDHCRGTDDATVVVAKAG
jgi:anti-sigma regulatory factor (Ser/Thr protein kinase)